MTRQEMKLAQPLDIDCRSRASKFAAWLYDEAFPVAIIMIGGLACLALDLYREWVIWTR